MMNGRIAYLMMRSFKFSKGSFKLKFERLVKTRTTFNVCKFLGMYWRWLVIEF
jgi:hypothetical protein